MATIFQVFDLKEAARAGAKQQVPERRYFDGGFEAPRNSLDVPYEATDVSRSTAFKGEDIPFGYEYFNPAFAAVVRRTQKGGAARSLSHGNSPRQSENRKRAPNVVARLMGLEALPDELPTRKNSLPSTPTHGSPVKPLRGNQGLTRQRSQGAVPSSWQRPPLPRQVQRAPATGEEERVLAPVLPFRDHPQEEQLRKFKKEFEAKQQAALAKKQEQLRTLQLQDMNRELEEKKEKVRATLDKAKSVLSQGIVAQEPKRLSAQGQFEESKEFLDAMEFLQSNKDLIFEFLQQKPQVAGKNGNSNTATPVTLLKSVKKGKGNTMSPSTRKRDGFSPRALARLIMNPRKWSDSKQQPATPSSDIVSQPSARAQPTAIDRGKASGSRGASTEERETSDKVKLRSSSFTNSRSELRAPLSPTMQSKPPRDEANVPNKGGSRDVIVKIMERLRQKEQCGRVGEVAEKERFLREQAFRRDSNARNISENARESSQSKNNFTLTEYFSTGRRVSIHLENMDDVRYTSDGEHSSTPLVKIVRENAIKRSSISLPSSPHLSARSNDVATSSKVIRKRGATEKHGTPPAATHKEAKKTTLTSETPRRRQGRGSLLSNTEVENSLRKSASVNENASRSEDVKQRVEASAATTSRRFLQEQNIEPASNLTRSRSIPNVALLRKRGKFSNEAEQKLGSIGERKSDKSSEGKSTAKSIPENPPKHRLCQQAEKTKGFFAGARKKVRDGSEAMPSVQNLLFPSTTPVLARFAALAESCVSQGNTLSDADNAVGIKLNVRSIGNAGAKEGKENSRVQDLPSEKELTSKMFGEPSQAEIESVVSESSADSDADSCDGEFFEALAQLRPLAKTTTESVVAGEALPNTVFVPRVHQQVHNVKKSPTHFNISNKVDDELDSNSDNSGQPSPVSVLEAPFEEESPTVEFKEIADSRKDLRLRLNLLKDEGGERTEGGLKHVPEIAHTPRLKRQHQFLDSARENQTPSDLQQRKTNATKPNRQFATTASPNQEALPCLAGQEAHLAFVANVLVGSDFITHGGRLISKWHSATQPISPNLYDSLEASHYSDYKGSANRRILFDAINDILAAKLRPLCYEPWASSHSSGAVVRTGRRLVADLWNEICKRQFPAALWRNDLHDDYLESLVAQDLKSSTTWMSLHHDVHGICLQLEKSIFNSMITELCGDLFTV